MFLFLGLGSLVYFFEDFGELFNQEEDYESEGEQSNEGNDVDDINYIDEQLERCYILGFQCI